MIGRDCRGNLRAVSTLNPKLRRSLAGHRRRGRLRVQADPAADDGKEPAVGGDQPAQHDDSAEHSQPVRSEPTPVAHEIDRHDDCDHERHVTQQH